MIDEKILSSIEDRLVGVVQALENIESFLEHLTTIKAIETFYQVAAARDANERRADSLQYLRERIPIYCKKAT